MKSFTVTFYFVTSHNPKTDLKLSAIVDAINRNDALFKAKLTIRYKNPNLNFGKNWAWHSEEVSQVKVTKKKATP